MVRVSSALTRAKDGLIVKEHSTPIHKLMQRLIPGLLVQNRDFVWFWSGQTVSLFGDEISLLAIPLTAVILLHATAAQMGYLFAVALAPNLLFSLHAGNWVDRRGKRRQVMIGSDIGRALLLVTMPIAYVLGILTLGQLYVVAFLALPNARAT